MRPKLDIDPLSDARWTRIERSVLADAEHLARPPASGRASKADARSTRWRGAAALVLAGAAAAVVGGVAVRTFLMPAAPVATASRVITDAKGSHIRVGASELDVSPRSAVVVSGDDTQGILVVVDRGEVECEVAPRLERPPFTVLAGDVRVVVVGTHFIVRRDGDSASVEVMRGIVDVSSPGEHVVLHPGERWPSSSVDAPPAALAEPPTGANAPPAPPSFVGAPPTTLAPPAAAAPSPRERYQSAAKLEASEPDRAIAIYRELARGGGAWAMNALFAQARLEADRGNRAESRRLLGDYLARYPRGPNADDAHRLLDRML